MFTTVGNLDFFSCGGNRLLLRGGPLGPSGRSLLMLQEGGGLISMSALLDPLGRFDLQSAAAEPLKPRQVQRRRRRRQRQHLGFTRRFRTWTDCSFFKVSFCTLFTSCVGGYERSEVRGQVGWQVTTTTGVA